MYALSNDTESGVESQLVDIGTLPLSGLRSLRGMAVQESIQHVLQQIGQMQVCEQKSCHNWFE